MHGSSRGAWRLVPLLELKGVCGLGCRDIPPRWEIQASQPDQDGEPEQAGNGEHPAERRFASDAHEHAGGDRVHHRGHHRNGRAHVQQRGGRVKNLGRYAASWMAGWPNCPSSTVAPT